MFSASSRTAGIESVGRARYSKTAGPGIDKHPDYAALAARTAAWREKQFELYQSLKMSDE
jgi:hypothetical protein